MVINVDGGSCVDGCAGCFECAIGGGIDTVIEDWVMSMSDDDLEIMEVLGRYA